MARTRTRLVTEHDVPTPAPSQLPFPIRLIWFCVVGWWLGGAWLLLTACLAPLVGIFAWGTIAEMWRAGMTMLTLERR